MNLSSLGALSVGALSLYTVLKAILIFLVCYIVIRILMTVVTKALGRSTKLDGTLKGFITTAVRIALWVLAIIIVADSLGISTASLVTVVGIAGLALSLAIQNVMSNLFSGITLLITHPFGQGDLVDIGSNQGVVKSVGLFYTVVDTLDNKVVSIPNSDVTASSVTNYSREPLRRVDMTFSASYDSSTEDVKSAILDAVSQDSKIMNDPAPFIVIGKYGDSSIEYIVRLWCKNEDYWDVYFGMNEHVRESFAKHGVQMSYAHVNVHVVQ
jgi:small conductance mechanosensitive channel